MTSLVETQKGSDLQVKVISIEKLLIQLDKAKKDWVQRNVASKDLLRINWAKQAPRKPLELYPYGRNGLNAIHQELGFQSRRIVDKTKDLQDKVFLVREQCPFGDRIFDLNIQGISEAQNIYKARFTSLTTEELKRRIKNEQEKKPSLQLSKNNRKAR